MIYLQDKAVCCCDEQHCQARQEVRLVLGMGGQVMFEASDIAGWQLLMNSGMPGQPPRFKCPVHHTKLLQGGDKGAVLRKSN